MARNVLSNFARARKARAFVKNFALSERKMLNVVETLPEPTLRAVRLSYKEKIDSRKLTCFNFAIRTRPSWLDGDE